MDEVRNPSHQEMEFEMKVYRLASDRIISRGSFDTRAKANQARRKLEADNPTTQWVVIECKLVAPAERILRKAHR